MAKFTLFLIHGIGVHRDAGWAQETTELLEQAWSSSVTVDVPMSDRIEVVPISYDSVFEDYLDDFSDVTKAVFNDAIDMDQHDREMLAESLEDADVNNRHFVLSYISDVLLYKMDIVKEQVNASVAKQLYDKVSQLGTQDSFGIVAHSLGTRVINDTLQNIRSGQADQSNFYHQGYRLKFLMQISDVTDLFGLPFQQDSHPPHRVYSYDTYDYLRTVTNRFDPIARMIPTRLTHWPEGRTQEQYLGRPVYKDILLEHVHDTNVHGLTHYMLHPGITDELFDLCGYGRMLTDQSLRLDSFPPLGPDVQPSLKTALQGLMSDALGLANDTWQTYINVVIKYGDFSEQHNNQGNHA